MAYTSTFSFIRTFLFCGITVLSIIQTTVAQAPGGVSTNLKLWLKANTSVTPAVQGAAVTAWNDLSGGSNHATIPALTPIVLNPTYQQNTLNFNPSIRFAGTSNLSFSALSGLLTPAITSNNVSVYTVFLMNSTTSAPGRVVMVAQNPLTSDWQNMAGANLINRDGTSINGYRNGIGGPSVGPVLGTPVIASTHFTASNQWKTEINGNAFTSAAFTTTAFNAGYFRLGQSTYSNDDYFNGDIAEVILYTADQSSLASHNQIESYLAVKYGIHKTGSYVNSSGTNIWDATANAAYHNDVFGIGQDNASGLIQVQSNSTNTGDGSGTGQSGKGNISISNPSSLANNTFLMIGHNTGALTEADIIDAGNPTKRIARIWKVQRTGNPGTVTLNYDRAGLTYSGTLAADYTLLVDPTGAGNFSGSSVITYKAAALNGSKFTFNNIDLPNGAVFTFQTLFTPVTPTVQATEVNFSNTTTTGAAINWTNGDGGLRAVFIRQASSGTPSPVNNTTYNANTVFGSGTQIGATGWFCIYNGIGTNVNVTGLTTATTYQVMVVEYNGSISGNEIYHSLVSTNNPVQLITNTVSSSTIGPGGVITGLQLWLDAGNGAVASGSNLTAWSDLAGINTFAVSATPPTVNNNAINFHSTVAFNNSLPLTTYPATQNLIGNTSITYVDAYGVFKENNSAGGTIIGGTSAVSNYGLAVFTEQNSRMFVSIGKNSTHSSFAMTQYTDFHLYNMDASIAGGTTGRLDGVNQTMAIGSGGTFSSFSMVPTVGTTNNGGNGSGWDHLNGQIAEVVIYNQSTAAQRTNIESYLSLKYGIHKTGNYIAGNNAVIWDATANTAYHNDVFGIGMDDLSGLNQVISNSMNTGGGDGTGQSGKGNIVISNPASLVNNSFLVIGHNTNALTETSVVISSNLTVKRVQRNWKVQTTGVPGAVTLSYDITGLSYSGQTFNDYVLLVDPTGTGNFNGGTVVKYPAASLSGNKVSFNTVLLPTGSVFTFQTLSTPTVQAVNLVFSGTAGTTTTASWTNGNGSSRAVFVHTGITGSPVPVDNTTYTANAAFGSGTQIGTSGWYCIYNGTGTTVNITGLTPGTSYQVMAVEYNGIAGSQLYLPTVSIGNPAAVTTLNNVATLSNLTISQGTLTPTFAAGTTNYTVNVANAVTTLTVTPTTTDANATVKVDGVTVTSGSPSGLIGLAVGPNVITTVVIAQDGTTFETYTITVNRTAPAAILASGTLTALTTTYGTPSASGTFTVSGTNMLDGVLVTAPSGFEVSSDNITFTNTVTIGAAGTIASTPVYIRLKASSPAGSYLGDIVLTSPGATTVNFAIVSSTVTKAALTITADDKTKAYGTVNPTLTVSYSGFVNGDAAASLTTAPTIATTAVTGSAVGTYPITASAAVSSNYTFTYVAGTLTVTPLAIATLSGLTISQGTLSPVFATGTTSYTANVTSNIANITVTPTTTDTNATVTVNGTAVTSGNPSGAINLVAGPNVITIVVTAQDGTTTQTYTVTVTKAAAPPIVTNFSPQTGPIGTTVTITGSNFGATIAENIVFFGATKATITAASTTSLTVTVPIGASYEPISVLNSTTVLSGNSNTPFITTFAPNKGRITIDDIMPKVDFAVGSFLSSVASGDFDGDGKPDLVLGKGSGTNSVGIYRNTSVSGTIDGSSFINAGTFVVENTPNIVKTADMDGDGKLDIIVTNSAATNTISVLRNISSGIGNISFAARQNFVLSIDTYGLAIGDIDGDGKPDIVTSSVSAGSASVLRNISSGAGNINFSPGINFTAVSSCYGLDLGDLDGDGKLDMVVTNDSTAETISVFLNTSTNGIITFNPKIGFSTGFASFKLRIGDINKDGKTDVVVGNSGNNSISVLQNTSASAGSLSFAPKIDLAADGNISQIAIGDLDGDGIPDLGASLNNASLNIFRNTGSGGTISFAPKVSFVNNSFSNYIAIEDLDGDGKNDLATVNNNTLSLFRNNPLFAPTAQATNVVFTATTGTSTTASWTNGNGSSRAVFMYAGASGSPLPVDLTVYTANAAFGAGTQIGTSGWYCVYNGTGTTVNITGLTPATAYQVMVVERNGSAGDEMYLSTVSTGNPAGVTTLNNVATLSNLTISQGTLTPVFATGTTLYTATVANAVTSLTVTPTTTDPNATVTVNGVPVTSGSPSGAIALAVGPNVITTVVTAQDGTTIETYTVTVNRTAAPAVLISGVLTALTTTYGTASASTSFNVSGTNMLDAVLVTAPSGFEVSTDNSTFTNTVAIGGAGTIASTPVYVRLKGTIAAGSYSGDIVLTSNSMVTVNVPTISSTVNPAALTITSEDKTKVYGSANPALTVTYAGFTNGDTVASLTTAPNITTTATAGSIVGTYPITASGAVSPNYVISYVNGTLTVTQAALTITADNQTKTYGAANPAFTASYTGFVNGDTAASLTTQPTITTTATAGSIVGTYPITASGAVSANYAITYVDGTLTVTQAALTITAENKTKVYSSANPALTVTYSGFVNSDTASSLTTQPAITTTAVAGSIVGTYPITASGAVAANYAITYVDGTLTVTQAALTITAEDKTKVYGSANPALTVTYSGFVNSDTAASLTTAPTITTTAVAGSIVGTYPITASGAVAANYAITYVDGTLTVTQAALTITAEDKTKAYGSANPVLTVTYSGFLNGDTVSNLTTAPSITTTAAATSAVGTYPITASGAVSANYAITYVDGTLTVTQAALTITAEAKTKVYGDANPVLTVTYSGFVNGDSAVSLTTAPAITTTAVAASGVGTYPITASGAVSANYAISYVDAALTVTAATLTITADDKNKVYGDANPVLTISYAGFANGDTVANLLTPPTISTTATTASPVGTYPITVSGASGPNYIINYVNGTLTVSATTLLTIVADNQSKVYGDANPALTVSYVGFVNGDTEADLTTLPAITTTAVQSSPVGTYPITASGAASPNYTIAYTNGTLTVNPASLTVTADAQTKVYGDANPALTVSYSGFVNGDTVASLTTAPTVATTAVTASPVGTYPITASGAVNPNYTFNYIAGNLAITTAALTITADDKTKVYGDANPALTVTYSGFVNGDSETSLTTPPTISTTATTASSAGTYPITASGAVNSNYTIAYTNGTLTVSPASLTVTADAQTKVYGDANPTLTVSYTGFVNGDTEAGLTTPPTISTTATTASPVGTYPITASGAVSSNYTIAYTNGNLTVNPASLTVTADAQTKVYGDANPALTVSYAGFVNGDSETSFTTPPAISTTAVTASPVGTYPITASGAVSANYTISYVDGILTVTPATLTITAEDKTKVYGDANPALTVTYSGFANGDTVASLTTPPTVATTAALGSPVGTYPIAASGGVDSNYIFNYVDGSLTVTVATLTVTGVDKTKVYGDANPTLTATYSGFVNGETEADLLTLPTITTTAVTSSPVGTYPIVVLNGSDPNYTFNYIDGTLTVTPAALTITAEDKTKVYGDANPALTVTYSGFVNGDSEASLTTAPTITTTAVTGSAVGTYPITASGAVNTNYTFNYVDGTLTVTPALLTITADDKAKVYGDANPALTVTYTGFTNGDTEASLTTVPTITTTAVTGSIAGTYPITASGAVSANYAISYVDGSLTVTPALLTITADDKAKVYGDANPALTVSYSGFVNGDSETSLTTTPTIVTTATAGSIVGTYPITASGAVSANYAISYVDGSLTVNPALLTITADDKAKVYGDANPALTVSYSGFVNGDSETSLTTTPTIVTTATAGSIVGTYPITASGAVSANYTISYVDGTLTVTPATLTITAEDKTKVYGDANPALTVTYAGFANGDTVASLTTAPTITTTAVTGSAVGTYPITASGAVNTNYTFNYVDGTLTVTPAALTITAEDKTKVYGDANPALTVAYSGFVNGDSEASLTTAPTITTTAVTGSAVGTYPITASGAVNTNYTISYVDGTLTVNQAILTITADDKTKVYGDANPALTVAYSGFVNGDSEASLTTVPTITTTAVTGSIVGTYPITASGAVSANYTFNYVDGNLTVTPAALTITADDKAKVYGDANPALTVSYSGFVNGDSETILTTTPTIVTTATAGSIVGTYPITASGAVSANYTISYVDGTLTVNQAALTITADNQTKVYGDANPALTVTYAGFVNGDSEAGLTTAPTIATTAVAASAVGTYPIAASGAVSTNYTISYVDGTLTVTPAALTITAEDKTKVYGDANPALTVTYAGFVNGDSEAGLTTAPTITTTAVTGSAVGTYPITASGAVNSNYAISYVDGTLTVTGAILTITADNQTKIYGDANPALTAAYSGFVNGDTEADLTTLPTITTTAVQNSSVGVYPITASGAVISNYTITYVPGILAVTPANLAIAADDKTKIYGEANPAFTFTYTGFVNGDTEADLTTPPVGSTTADASSPVGIYPITISGATSSNYTIGYTSGATLAITPANLAIAAADKTKIYGEANPGFTFTYTGFVNGDTEADLTTPPVGSTTADASSPVGIYPITISGATSSNYTIGYTAGATLTITPALLTITAENKTKVYGDANPALTTSYSGFVNGDTASSLTTPPVIATTAVTGSSVGTYPITASGAVSANYAISYVDGTLTVTQAALIITADNQTKTYGSANPALTASYSGFVNGDTASSLTTPPVIATTAVTGSSVGTYPITASGAVSANYAISYVDGTLTVTQTVLTITADNQTKTYGSANPALTASYSGFVNGDTASSLTTPPVIATTAVTGSSVGTYPITVSGAVSANYAISYVDGTLTVTQASLTITADNQTKTYGSVNPVLTVTYSGFVNGDTASSLTTPPVIATTAVTGSSVGTYPITASGAVSSNYAISYVDGTLTVTQVALIITADNQTKTYGSVNPALTASYSGFVNGDTASSLSTAPVIVTTAVTGSNVGTYSITASGAVSANYTISYVNGNLSVTAAPLTITADNKSRAYGAPNPPLTASYSGFVNGDTAASLTIAPNLATIANATSPIGVYAITVSGAAAPNYNISYVTGVLTVTSPTDVNLASLTITNGVLSPPFSPNTLLYNVTVGSTINTETITVAADDPLAKITINGTPILSNSSFSVLSLESGVNIFNIKVTSEDGSITKTYVLNIIKEGSDDASLSNLAISQGTLNPAFESDVNNYNAVVKYDTASITVTPTASDPGSTITVNGITVPSGSASVPIILKPGENTIETIVTAGNGVTKETYTITVYKGVSPDEVFANNILSPNGDGKNDFWEIKDILLYPNNTVTVYDRAGRIVYSKKSYSNEWDGSYGGSPLNNDTYYYLIDLGDNLPKIKGFITMIRD